MPWEPSAGSEGQRPTVSFAADGPTREYWARVEDDLVERLAAVSERVFNVVLPPEAVRARLLLAVQQSKGGDWLLKAKLPAGARFWDAAGAPAERPTSLARSAARVRLQARSLWLMSGQCGLTLEVTDLRFEEPRRECPL